MSAQRLAFVATISLDAGAWNHVAPIFEGERHRVKAIARGSKGRDGETYSITRTMAEEAIQNLGAIQGGEIPILLRHPFEREAIHGALPSTEFRRLGHVAELAISADGQWLDGRYVWTEEGRALVASGQFPQMSPTVFFDTQDRDGRPVGCSVFEVSLVPVGEFRDQGRLAAAVDAAAEESARPMEGIMKRIMELLGVAEEADVVPALEKMIDAYKSMAASVQSFASVASEVEALKRTTAEQRDQIRALVAANAEAQAVALVAEGRAAGKIIPATEKYWHDDAVENLARTRDKLTASPVLKRYGPQGAPGLPPTTEPSTTADTPADASALITIHARKLVSEGKAKDLRTGMSMAMCEHPELATAFSGIHD